MWWSEVEEARLERDDGGLAPAGPGWFIVNVADARGLHSTRFGHACRFEGSLRFPELGVNVRVLEPGQPACLYHRENGQEAFLVLSGECLAVVEEQERPLRTGDLLHCPPGTAHVLVGAGEALSTVLMVGVRKQPDQVLYPVSDVAGRHFASVERETEDQRIAYASVLPPRPAAFGTVPWEEEAGPR